MANSKAFIRFSILFILLIFITNLCLFAERIVTLAPAITEIVFKIGKGDNIVGDTKFCDYPEKAKKIKNVGGYMDTNIEILVSLKPDVVFLYPEQYNKLKFLENKTKLIQLKHKSIKDILNSIKKISSALNIENKGNKLVSTIKKSLNKVHKKTKESKKKKTLMVLDHNPEELSNMYIVGKNDFLNQLLHIAGGINAYEGNLSIPQVSVESIMQMKPEYIIEFSAFYQKLPLKKIKNLWIKNRIIDKKHINNIKIVKNNFWLRPGPRITKIAEDLYDFLNHNDKNK